MTQHYVKACKHGVVVEQCRCFHYQGQQLEITVECPDSCGKKEHAKCGALDNLRGLARMITLDFPVEQSGDFRFSGHAIKIRDWILDMIHKDRRSQSEITGLKKRIEAMADFCDGCGHAKTVGEDGEIGCEVCPLLEELSVLKDRQLAQDFAPFPGELDEMRKKLEAETRRADVAEAALNVLSGAISTALGRNGEVVTTSNIILSSPHSKCSPDRPCSTGCTTGGNTW